MSANDLLVIGVKIAGYEDGIQHGASDLRIDAMGIDGMEELAEGSEATLPRIQGAGYVTTLELPAVRMMVITTGRIAQRNGTALLAIGFDVNTGADWS